MSPDDQPQRSDPPFEDRFNERCGRALMLLSRNRLHIDQLAVQRAILEAMQAWPGEDHLLWWRWLLESGRGLGLSTRVVEASLPDLLELVRHGVSAVTLTQGPESQLLVLTDYRRGQVLVNEVMDSGSSRWSSSERLRLNLGSERGSSQRWVILDPLSDEHSSALDTGHTALGAPGSVGSGAMNQAGGRSGTGGHGDGAHGSADHISPFRRLIELLRPERADIWIIVIFAIVMGLLMLAAPITVEALVNTVAFGTFLQPLIVLAIIVMTFLAFAGGLRYLQRYVVEILQRRLFARVAGRVTWQLPHVRYDQAEYSSPELMNRFLDIVTVQKSVAQMALDGLTILLTIGLGMLVLAFYHPWLLAFDLVLVLIVAVDLWILGHGAVRTSIAESKAKYAVIGWFEDILRCRITFKGHGAAEFARGRADRLTSEYLACRHAHYRILSRQILCGVALEALASAILLGLGGFLVIRGQLTLGQLVAAELIVTLIVASIAKLDKQLEGFYDLLAAVDKLGHVFDLPLESTTGIMYLEGTGAMRVTIRDLSLAHGGIRLSDLMEAAPGELIAVTGPPGSGKSLLLDVLFRLIEPTSGRVLLNDTDLRDLSPIGLRRDVCLVRGVEIIEATLAENIHLGRPEISDTVVRNSMRQARLWSEVQSADTPSAPAHQQELSLTTRLAYDGRPLSDSQSLKLMIARALAGRPRLLLIDGTLDGLTVDDIQGIARNLKALRGECTFLIATNRPEVAENCDHQWKL